VGTTGAALTWMNECRSYNYRRKKGKASLLHNNKQSENKEQTECIPMRLFTSQQH
jgi:hypothetical protein